MSREILAEGATQYGMVMQETGVCANLTGGDFFSATNLNISLSLDTLRRILKPLSIWLKDIMDILRLTYTPSPAYCLLMVMDIEFN